uniref:Midasin n=1 Tax=Lygus hesperus TaxID=30085 RepID=A0A0A9Z198_LYGHE
MDVIMKKYNYPDQGGNPTNEYIIQSMIALKMELDKLEGTAAKKREAHRRILLKDLLVIKQNLGKEKRNNGVNLLIEHFNNKVTYSLRTTSEYSQKSLSDFMKFLKDVEYISNELTDRLILDTSMPEYEKSMLGKELYQFRQDAKAHIQEVDNFNYELRELLRGTNLKKLRGLSKEEYKERIHEIIAFIEAAEVPLRVFKTVGFAMQKTEELPSETTDNGGVYGVSGPLENDYPADEP